MDINNIINKPDDVALDINEMTFVVQEYIKDKKGNSVKISENFGLNIPMVGKALFSQHVEKLSFAYNFAKVHYMNKL